MVRAGRPSIAPRLLDRRQPQKESHQANRLRNTVVQQQAARTRPTLEAQGPLPFTSGGRQARLHFCTSGTEPVGGTHEPASDP